MTTISKCVTENRATHAERERAVNVWMVQEALIKRQDDMRKRYSERHAWTQRLALLAIDGQTCVVSFRIYISAERYLLLRLPCTLHENVAHGQNGEKKSLRGEELSFHRDVMPPSPALPLAGTVRRWTKERKQRWTDVPISLDPSTDTLLPEWPTLRPCETKCPDSQKRESDLHGESADQKYRRTRYHYRFMFQRFPALADIATSLMRGREFVRIAQVETQTETIRAFHLKSLCETVTALPGKTAAEYTRWQTIHAAMIASTSLGTEGWSSEMRAVLEFWTIHLAEVLRQPGQLILERSRGGKLMYGDNCYWMFRHTLSSMLEAQIAIDHIEFGNTHWSDVRFCAGAKNERGYMRLFAVHRLAKNLRPVPSPHTNFGNGEIHEPSPSLGSSIMTASLRLSPLQKCASTRQIDAIMRAHHHDDGLFHALLIAAGNRSRYPSGERHAVTQNTRDEITLNVQHHISVRDLATLVFDYLNLFVLLTNPDIAVSSPMTHPYPIFPRPHVS
jgi:hypothetical protein